MIKESEIKVIESPKIFYLAGEGGWFEQAGHEIVVKGYRFSVIPQVSHVNISEVETGMLFYKLPFDLEALHATETKEGTLDFIEGLIGTIIYARLKNIKDFQAMIKKQKKKIEKRIGRKPKTITFSSQEELEEYTKGGIVH